MATCPRGDGATFSHIKASFVKKIGKHKLTKDENLFIWVDTTKREGRCKTQSKPPKKGVPVGARDIEG